ncbi:rhodanese-like domain-containing protein [Bergeriella denitrificans]|nr:rhodanese-like domain-containing protein [Bergeriella denitrificans]
MKKLMGLLVLSAAMLSPVAAQSAEKPAAVAGKQAVKAKGIWIDVRSPEEFAEGHIQGAVNIPVDQIAERIRSVSPDKNAPVNLYCRSGRRAEAALQILQKAGYTRVTNHGGYQDLVAKGIR